MSNSNHPLILLNKYRAKPNFLSLDLVGFDVVQLHVVQHLVRHFSQHALRQHGELQARVTV